MCVCLFSKCVGGGSKIGENASNAAMELWLSAKSPGWRLLAALLSQFSHNHPVKSGHFLCHVMWRGHVLTVIVSFAVYVHVQTTVPWLLLL